jgi:NAD(P)-dependent dehydrogenase (short-subunit alcohol dehydrogenase family)
VQVSCAGIAGYTAAVDHTPETWHKVLNVNLHGTFWTAQAAGRSVLDYVLATSALYMMLNALF